MPLRYPPAQFSRASWICVLALLAGWICPAAQALDIPAQGMLDLEPNLSVLRDADHQLDADAAWAALNAGRFTGMNGARAQFGFTADTIWLAARLHNPSSEAQWRWLLVEHPRLDQVDVYLRDAGAQVEVHRMGDSLPFAQRARDLRFPNVRVVLAPNADLEMLIAIRSTSSVQAPVRLYDEVSLDSASARLNTADAFYYGLLVALLLYNLAVLLAIRDQTYLYYVLYVACFGLLMLATFGLGFQWLWPRSPWLANAAIPMLLALTLATTTQFQRVFLDLRRQLPRFDRWFTIAVVTMLALALVAPFVPTRAANIAGNLGAMLMSTLALGSAALCAWRGYKPANYFLLAWMALIIGGIAMPLTNFGVLQPSVLTLHGVQIGSAVEMLLLAFALASRINVLRSDNERLMGEARMLLEHRVDERTRELHTVLDELESANRFLRESSLRDGLTGLYNRRYLDETLNFAAQRSSDLQQPLSILMLDLDHFKAINDRRGHGVGDDCLRSIAARIAAAVETDAPLGLVARYGGEEFAVVLPDFDLAHAVVLAERLRRLVAHTPVATSDGDVAITISVGAAAGVPKNQEQLAGLMRTADQSLYDAKHRGRDRVVAL